MLNGRRARTWVSGGAAVTLALGMQVGFWATSAQAATTFTVDTFSDIAANAGACGDTSTKTAPDPLSLREAVCLANNNGGTSTITIPAGTYSLIHGELAVGTHVGQDVTLSGAGAASTTITAGGASRVLDFDQNVLGGVAGTVSGLTIAGGADSSFGGAGIIGGSVNASTADTLTVTNSTITDNHANGSTPDVTNNPGGGIQFIGGTLTITGSTISNNSSASSPGAGVAYEATGKTGREGLTISNTTFSANSATNTSGTSATNGGALDLRGPPTTPMQVTDSQFVDNTVAGTGPGGAVGAAIRQESGALTVLRSTFTGNSVTNGTNASGGAIYVTTGTATLHYNRFAGNTAPFGSAVLVGTGAGAVNATDNWFGCNGVPGSSGCDSVVSGASTAPTLAPRLQLLGSASPTTVKGPNGLSTVSASLTTDSNGGTVAAADLTAFDGLPVTWTDPQPEGATVASTSSTISSGVATVSYNSQDTSGNGHVVGGLDHGTVTVPLVAELAPAVADQGDPSDETVNPGETASFTASASGVPTPTVQWQRSTDRGESFSDLSGETSATLSFTAVAGDDGSQYRAMFSNDAGNATTAAATLTVNHSPAFTSEPTATFAVGTAGTFAITTSGKPTVSTIDESGTLPSGLMFTDNGDGTAKIAGTPDTGASGAYSVALTASNGISPAGTQDLTVQVNRAPSVTTDPSDQTVQPNTPVSFVAAADGLPTPSVQWQRSTDGGASFTDLSGETSTTLSFTAVAGDNGNRYRALFTNAAGTATTDAAILHVGTAPAFTSGNATTFAVGSAGDFPITVSGVPDATISATGTLPAWLTVTDNDDNTASLSGTPPTGSGGQYSFTLHASNGFSPAASQPFTLTVDESPKITSAGGTSFEVGSNGSFTVTTTPGNPATAMLTESGGLPTGVGFVDNGNGTATLSGTPDAGSGGTYPLTITAANGVDPAATQAFTLTVHEAPGISSADHATFTVGSSATFTVMSTGVPTAALTRSGTLPGGVTFVDNGNGTATLSGTPDAGSGGTYPLTITAGNGVDPAATQAFTLTVHEAPGISSADHATFTVGSSATFTVVSTGVPTAALTKSGSLPSGVGFVDNGNGTATLSGTPDPGTNGSYPLTFTAANTTDHADQSFTLTVVKAPQTITISSTPPSHPAVDGSYTIAAGSDSGLAVAFSIDAATTHSACSISGADVSFDHSGTCVIDADQSGNGTFQAAPRVQQSLTVTAIATSVGVVSSKSPTVFGQAARVTATVSADRGTPAGTVQFAVDGDDLGAPVTVADGEATSAHLTDSSGDPLTPGAHPVTATFLPGDATTYAGASGTVTQVVDKAATTVALTVQETTLTAAIGVVPPGAGAPSGLVHFSVGGKSVGSAAIVDGVATLQHTVDPGKTQHVAASYGGDHDFAGSSDSTSRRDPSIVAAATSKHAKTHFGWYRSPVTISFSCTAHGAPLIDPCPAAVHLTHDGAGQSVTRTVRASDGGASTAVVRNIDIDQTAPTVRVAGLPKGTTRGAGAPTLRCVGHDQLSGIASCTITKHTSGGRTHYSATAVDRAGNQATVSGSYRRQGQVVNALRIRVDQR